MGAHATRGMRVQRAVRHLWLVCVCVTAVTAVVTIGGYSLVAAALGQQTATQRASDAFQAQLSAANTLLSYVVHLGASSDGSVSSEQAGATRQAVESWEAARIAGAQVEAALVLSAEEHLKLAELEQRDQLTFQDMLSAAQAVLSAVPAAQAGDASTLRSSVSRFAGRQAAYADAVTSENSYLEQLASQAATKARTDGWMFTLIALAILGVSGAFLIGPAIREFIRARELGIRAEEENQRLGSEIARHAAERDRKEAEAEFLALFSHATMGVALADENGTLLDVNPALERMLGYNGGELRGTRFEALALPGFKVSDPTNVTESIIRRKDGSTFWVELTQTQALGVDGATLAVMHMVQDIHQRKEAEAKLRHDATHDSLTGLHNRAFLEKELIELVARARRGAARPFAALMIDLDRFKHVNDTRGHVTGDLVLVEVARRLSHCITENHIIARYGGDEFVAVLTDVSDLAVAVHAAEALQHAFDEPICVGGLRLRLSTSIGICSWDPKLTDCDAIIRAADNAAYRAKALGRARSVVYDLNMFAADDLRRRVAGDLRAAISKNELSLVYQPIMSLRHPRLRGFEALARWSHHELGDIEPSVFIPVAEETGLMDELGGWVLHGACAQLSQWRSEYPLIANKLTLNVNISAQQMVNPRFPDTVKNALAQWALAPGDLALELTETAMFDGRGPLHDVVAELRLMGIHIVLDDFGTGYSSLNHLRRLNMDALKVDHSFVSDGQADLAAPAIVEALMAVAKAFKIEVVAEGVETWRQAASLSSLGCDAAQGFLFARGLEPDRATEFLCNDATGARRHHAS
jgi:diguanylate cyclase (GGDEF)-like protein/PAS domain S-box-containing protein